MLWYGLSFVFILTAIPVAMYCVARNRVLRLGSPPGQKHAGDVTVHTHRELPRHTALFTSISITIVTSYNVFHHRAAQPIEPPKTCQAPTIYSLSLMPLPRNAFLHEHEGRL
ncbi:hypothetical protein BDW02DRAFT_77276 [Decorospora gaudefroyi]|uniref:Uncharacterized protein n=1 Tax=Decorospora gaudefroyi TaxID=184978 RepID=A0A6A5K287_9PLEO|nr:hypothetical protein BDW02DRAFT_77276 [Decorospora gaudefroyi]